MNLEHVRIISTARGVIATSNLPMEKTVDESVARWRAYDYGF